MRLLFLLVLFAVFLVAGCAQQPSGVVCADGSKAETEAKCPSPNATPTASTIPSATAPTPSEVASPTSEPVGCTLDAKVCPDGSAVGRVPPNCEFAPCPETTPTPSQSATPSGQATLDLKETSLDVEAAVNAVIKQSSPSHPADGLRLYEARKDSNNNPTLYMATVEYQEILAKGEFPKTVLYEVRVEKYPNVLPFQYRKKASYEGREYFTQIYSAEPTIYWGGYTGFTVDAPTQYLVNSSVGFYCDGGRIVVTALFNENVARVLNVSHANLTQKMAGVLLPACTA